MTINDILSDMADSLVELRGESIRSLFESQITAAAEHLLQANVPQVGDIAPDFALIATNGHTLTLDQALSPGPVVLTFYRGSWCDFCNVALKEWQRALADFHKIGANVFAIAPETPKGCRQYQSAAKLDYELLSDVGNVAAEAYGLSFELPTDARQTLTGYGIDVGLFNGTNEWNVPITATFAINRKKQIVFVDCGPDYRKRADPMDVLSVLSSLDD